MRQRTGPNGSADRHVKEIKRQTRRKFSAEEKIRIVLDVSSECRVCHDGLIAPNLRGVVGPPIASVAAIGGYSEGLKTRKSETWTDQSLATFLTSPAAFAPGTGMTKSLPDEQSRANVIAFLKTLPPPR
jgi:cytochrome c2